MKTPLHLQPISDHPELSEPADPIACLAHLLTATGILRGCKLRPCYLQIKWASCHCLALGRGSGVKGLWGSEEAVEGRVSWSVSGPLTGCNPLSQGAGPDLPLPGLLADSAALGLLLKFLSPAPACYLGHLE